MGVFKWLRRERVTVTTRHNVSPGASTPEVRGPNAEQIGTIRTEEYKRDLAEFQARRSVGTRDLEETPVKKRCGRHSLPVSCTDCARDHDNTFNYEKKSAIKYKKKSQQRGRSPSPEETAFEKVPNIQFLFQNQVFMPGNMCTGTSYSDPQHSKRQRRRARRSPEVDFIVQRHIDFKDDETEGSPVFTKNNSLPFDIKSYLDSSKTDMEEVDGLKAAGDNKVLSQSSFGRNKDEAGDEKLWEVMSELKNFDQWADEQLQANTSKSDDSKSDTSAFGLPIVSSSNLDVETDRNKMWNQGKWGIVPVQIKKLSGITIDAVRKKTNTEINILRKCRHPNILLLMGLYPDVQNNMHIICESCIDTLFAIIHVKGQILSVQTAVHYCLDIANALVFLRMHGYLHTELTSMSIMITAHDTAKLSDLGTCLKLPKKKGKQDQTHETYTIEPHYVNIEDTRELNTADCDPLLSTHSSEAYIVANAVCKNYEVYKNSEVYRWQAPELFIPDNEGLVYPCSKSDVYSLCLVLYESCHATIPWKKYSYQHLKEEYTLKNTGVALPQNGTYPGCLLSLMQSGLKLQRKERIDLNTLQCTLQDVKCHLDDLEYIVIPARKPNKTSHFSSNAGSVTSPTDSDCLSPQNIEHQAVIHDRRDSSSDSSDKDCSKSETTPLYETIRHSEYDVTYSVPSKCFVSDEEHSEEKPNLKFELIPEKDFSSACSTPIAKIKARIKDVGTPGTLHRSDSTEYCSILSPNRTVNLALNENYVKDHSSVERTAKLSMSFTPKSYKPLHIKVPDFNLDSLKPLLKEEGGSDRASYKFDIKNYSLPTTPIARSNKLRKNAWLSGDLSMTKQRSESCVNVREISKDLKTASAPQTVVLNNSTSDTNNSSEQTPVTDASSRDNSPGSSNTARDSFTGLRRTDPPQDFLSPETVDNTRERTNSWSYKSSNERPSKMKFEEEVLANVNVKPLVAIHERWIYEANRKTGRSISLPEDNRYNVAAVKPASHCVDTLQKSLPQLTTKRPPTKLYRMRSASPTNNKNGGQWEQFCQARDSIAKSMIFNTREFERPQTFNRDGSKGSEESIRREPKVDQATDTKNIEEFIKDLIRKEFQHLLHEMSDDMSTTSSVHKNEDVISKGVAHIMESLKSDSGEPNVKKEPIKSFSRLKINGNNKPLLQITFSRSGENSLQVLDNCVNVTICDTNSNSGREKNQSMDETVAEDGHVNSLKRCQAFNAIQEARSTEDLYIDDDLSTQMQENFGGKVKLIPLHGSLHEILCEKEDECCLIKVKQENGCDTIYFRCDNSDTESKDAIDGREKPQDTVVFKRSISLIEERIQRIFPKERRAQTPVVARKAKVIERDVKTRPKSEVFVQNINKESRVLSNSSPSLVMNDKAEEVEVNIENAMCYQDSSSEECLKCLTESDDFEFLERKIEEDIANSNMSSLTCGCLEKISEENLSVINEEAVDKQ